MKHSIPEPPTIGEHAGLSYALFMPEGEPIGAVVVCHGAGSTKESHFEFGRLGRAQGLAVVAYDMRGHGRSEGELSGSMVEDVHVMCDFVGEHSSDVALRGSSMGSWCAIAAAARRPGEIAAVVALCPAPEDFLLRGLRSGTLDGFRADRSTLEPLLESNRLVALVPRLSPTTPLLLLHAQGDEQVPYAISEEVFGAAGEPKRLLILPGGHHRSLQHDLEIHAISLRFIVQALSSAARRPATPSDRGSG